MKIFKNKFFWIIIGLVAAGLIVFVIAKGKPAATEQYTTAAVVKGNLTQTVSATGKVQSITETNLSFKASGRITKIYVSSGAVVKSGQLLAQLESSQAASAVNQARASVAQAKAALDQIKAGASNEEISVVTAQLAQAKADLDSKNEALLQAEKERDQNIFSLKEQALEKTNDSIFLSKQVLDDVEQMLTNVNYKDFWNTYPNYYNQASEDYFLAVSKTNSLETLSKKYSVNSSSSDLVILLDANLANLNQVNASLSSTFDLLSHVSSGGVLTTAILSGLKTTISTDQTTVATKVTAAQTAKSNLQIKTVEYQHAADSAKLALDSAQAALNVAQAQLDLKVAGPRSFELENYQAKLAAAQANLDSALSTLMDYQIKAPVAGLISKINFELGESVTGNQAVMSLIGESNLEIEVDVPESDVAKVTVGDAVKITLDAFGDSRIFGGHVSFIDPAETIINDVVYYKIKVAFDQKETDVKPGMTANAIIATATRENVLFIPSRAVIDQGDKRIVRVLASGQKVEKEVTTGLRADEGMIEILSGLTEGETVITFIQTKK